MHGIEGCRGGGGGRRVLRWSRGRAGRSRSGPEAGLLLPPRAIQQGSILWSPRRTVRTSLPTGFSIAFIPLRRTGPQRHWQSSSARPQWGGHLGGSRAVGYLDGRDSRGRRPQTGDHPDPRWMSRETAHSAPWPFQRRRSDSTLPDPEWRPRTPSLRRGVRTIRFARSTAALALPVWIAPAPS